MTRTEDGWFSAYVATLPQGLSTITALSLPLRHPLEQRRHLDRGERRIPPLVSVRAAGAIARLIERLGGDHAERHRHAEVAGDVGDAARRLRGHVVEVRRLAANDGAEADHRLVLAGPGEP